MKLIWIIGLLALLSGCMPSARSVTTDVNKDKVEAALQAPLPDPSKTGSLWTGSSPLLFTDAKAHSVGDLVTVLVLEQASATRNLGTKKSKKSSRKTDLNAAFGVLDGINAVIAKNRALTPLDPKIGMDISDASSFDGSGSTNNSDTLTASVTAVVTKVYPNGNLEITGRRQVSINHQPQALVFTGIIRPSDISSDNTIASAKVAQAMVSYGSGGELAEVAHQGWLARTLNEVWPF
ncbi:flagellar L-ring protein precursor FlgH [Mariprofundus ferrinatatus]|uniref:Flagellar L-ring protein n=1 Tax=Mariprofundus ferrinatatus TaxID=1921087 RepID=A0A2K8LFA0_9PROT|nr:flagellar basal body L-ring protein FlgH [Mariprofundus ferrinatatus]ATX82946.1 flagellar L-ring protein precursor FlgH [Mariprofundus ferrinatatus]